MLTSLAARRRRWISSVALLLLALGLLVGPLTESARAEGTASQVQVEAKLALDGTLSVTQVVVFEGTAPAELRQVFETEETLLGDRVQVFELGGISGTAGGATVTPNVTTDGRFTTVTMPTNGAQQVQLTYTVKGAVVNVATGTALRWRLLQGLDSDVRTFTGTVAVPTAINYIRCTAGGPNSTSPCGSANGGTDQGQQPTVNDGPRGRGEVVGIEIGFPPGAMPSNEIIREVWSVGRAFSVQPLPLAVALGLLVLGGILLFVAHRRVGRDATPAGGEVVRVGEFVPTGSGQSEFRVVDEIRPGHVGTVADERVDPIDVTATLLDLAVRGHVLITELPRSSQFATTEWELTRRDGGDALRPFEQELLDGVTGDGPVRVAALPARVGAVIGGVQDKLYDEVVSHGWYERRPDATRNTWSQAALVALIVAVAVTGLLAAFTTFGLAGLALIAVALGFMFVAQETPARTSKGVALLSGLGALRSDLLNHPTDQMPPGRELTELSEVLPYAVVLGGADRWLDAIVAADTDVDPDSTDLSWYHGPDDWHLSDLPDSLRNFVTTVSGTLFSR